LLPLPFKTYKTEVMRISILAVLSLSIFLVSCGSNSESSATAEQPVKTEEMTTTDAPKYTPGAKMDPVCEMEWDNEWTEMTVYNNDTVRFCSEGCKKAFMAHPEKYMAVAK